VHTSSSGGTYRPYKISRKIISLTHNYSIKDRSFNFDIVEIQIHTDRPMSREKKNNRISVTETGPAGSSAVKSKAKPAMQVLREEQLLSKAELARRAGVSVLTIDRVEKGAPCRLDTKRKIILALGLKVQDKKQVFSDE
jgi:DNA-binding XRE family transcriptional regulator